MNSSDYDAPTNYVNSESTFQTLQTYNQYGTVSMTAGLGFTIYPVYGGYGNTSLLHNLPREEVNGCDYFSLNNAYPVASSCSKKYPK